MVGPFKTARGGMTHLLVAVHKFTKWIEARPVKKLDGPTAVRFVKDFAIRYGMQNNIITDNGTNFAKGALAQYCSVSGIHLDLASVAHQQSNEVVIPTDVEFDSPRITMYTEAEAKEAREDGVDLLEEARLLAHSRSAIYQQGLRYYHSKKIKPLAFWEGDLVL
ncbi:uncharacterized protein [Aegilops tauschii subsp. strangulata]|uniref:uncharacterized protein n=1 Tax=Aegilops tauschii subsp. strangulata TaxID=200361 RepID=UPI003CC83F1F